MEQLPTHIHHTDPTFKSQSFISTTAWLTLFCAAVASLYSGSRMYLSHRYQATITNQILEEGTPFADHFYKTLETIQLAGWGIIVISALFSLSALLLLQRRQAGRYLFTLLSTMLIIALISFGIYYRNQLSTHSPAVPPVGTKVLPIESNINPLILLQFKVNGILILAGLWMLTRLVIKLNTKKIRRLFA
ncbi:MAG: hypothetical protein R2795_01960 [Saprospiraceae bacterium]